MLPCYLHVTGMYWKAKALFAHSLWHRREFERLERESSPGTAAAEPTECLNIAEADSDRVCKSGLQLNF